MKDANHQLRPGRSKKQEIFFVESQKIILQYFSTATNKLTSRSAPRRAGSAS
jgi:hypothetical protein